MVQHIIQIGHLPLLVANDREAQLAARYLVNILDPAAMRVDRISREADQFYASFREFRFQFGKSAELCGTYGRVILGVGKKDYPVVTDKPATCQ